MLPLPLPLHTNTPVSSVVAAGKFKVTPDVSACIYFYNPPRNRRTIWPRYKSQSL
jgi:hypothetical protein